ncbi:hypothetical protein MLD38_004414 [Melastoma candidum]|uniref:Uncharacterized protein n=1 Tax=Melastoma candidum TaxID=119954 RepID=A0ACB9S609_9MYRT|nr:hypothetical protein MLD38_004414 [Melastoma candidum]
MGEDVGLGGGDHGFLELLKLKGDAIQVGGPDPVAQSSELLVVVGDVGFIPHLGLAGSEPGLSSLHPEPMFWGCCFWVGLNIKRKKWEGGGHMGKNLKG